MTKQYQGMWLLSILSIAVIVTIFIIYNRSLCSDNQAAIEKCEYSDLSQKLVLVTNIYDESHGIANRKIFDKAQYPDFRFVILKIANDYSKNIDNFTTENVQLESVNKISIAPIKCFNGYINDNRIFQILVYNSHIVLTIFDKTNIVGRQLPYSIHSLDGVLVKKLLSWRAGAKN